MSLNSLDLEHPKPLEMAIAILRELDNDSYMYMVNRRNPVPLVNLAQSQNFKTLSREIEDGLWHILVTPNHDVDLEEYIDV